MCGEMVDFRRNRDIISAMKSTESHLCFEGVPVRVRFSARRRRIGLAVERQTVLLLLPEGFSMRNAEILLHDHQNLIQRLLRQDRQVSVMESPLDFRIGGRLPLLGEEYEIRLETTPGKRPRFDGVCFRVTAADPAGIRRQILLIYRQLAADVINDRVEALAARHGISYGTVKINSASSRWGSCSAAGNLNFSWKLVLCPEPLLEYVVAHELAHRRQMNHSSRFWQEVEQLCPAYRLRRKLIREEARRLRSWRELS